MTITEIKIRVPENRRGGLLAFASVCLDGVFAVHGVGIIEGRDRRFLVMPSRRTKNGEYRDVAHPVVQRFRERLERAVLEEYDRAVLEAYGFAVGGEGGR
jgi:stage V sporulation protein G